jgi:HK97 family phage portal protein
MNSALRLRAELLLGQDRANRTAVPKAQGETYPLSTAVRGSTLYNMLAEGLNGTVSESSAMRIGAVHASVALIGGAIAAMPFHLYQRIATGRERYDSDVWWLLNESPCPAWTAASAWQFALQSILLRGDGFREIQRASPYSPRIIGFEPIHPDAMSVERVDGRNRYTYWVSTSSGTVERRIKDQDDILHFPGVGFDGLRSLTPIAAALGHAASLALDADNYASAFFRGGARADHAVVVPPTLKLDEDQKALLKESWAAQKQHYNATGVPPFLVGGMDIKQLTINANDAQLLETRQQSVEDIARIMGVPPHMIGKTDASTSWGSGIQQMSIGFVRYTLGRHLDNISQELNRKLWPRSKIYYGEFNRDALLEGDSKEQAEYLGKSLGGPGSQGWTTVNEVRRLKNLPPIDEPWANTVQRAGSKPLASSTDQPNPDQANA